MYSFILETVNIVNSSDFCVIEESKTESGRPKMAFRTKLQEQNVKNANSRLYTQAICEHIVNDLTPKVNSRSLLMEIDHPMSGTPEEIKRRAAIVELKNSGALIRNIKLENGIIEGEIETLSGFKGPDLASIILNDHVDIGFSLRALGSVQKRQDGILEVTTPMKAITYDIVTNPSFSDARIMQFIPETDLSNARADSMSFICENEDIELVKNDQVFYESDSIYCIESFVDQIIAEQILNVIGTKIKFNI